MNSDSKSIDLFAELRAIQDGDCIWCRLGFKHPPYSQCGTKKLAVVREVNPMVVFKTQRLDQMA